MSSDPGPTKNPSTLRSRGSEFKCRHGPTFPLKQYHRPHRLNGRIRNGNGCCPVGMGTDKNHHPALTGWRLVYFSTITTRDPNSNVTFSFRVSVGIEVIPGRMI